MCEQEFTLIKGIFKYVVSCEDGIVIRSSLSYLVKKTTRDIWRWSRLNGFKIYNSAYLPKGV